MNNYEKIKIEEVHYLDKTLDFAGKELALEESNLKDKRSDLIASRREMWENGPKSADDFDKIPELNHYLAEVNHQTQNYERASANIKKYKSMLNTPYFGRFDFKEDGYDDIEKIYIGLYSLMDMSDTSILVYDWRSPIAGMYYQCEIGPGSYTSPVGELFGDLSLKRQFNIENGKLQYFFDSSIQIKDEILQQVLSKNTSPKMRHIVETIQKEQDLIIRDTQSQLLMVQGVAGSGKTSIALHRIAYLLYTGIDSKLFSNNIMIISPNTIFSQYISSVLPSLGEDNVEQTTFDEITFDILASPFNPEPRNHMLEHLVSLHEHQDLSLKVKQMVFKNSLAFKKILDRLTTYYTRRLIPFQDIYYDNRLVKTKEQLLNELLNDQTSLPLGRKLNRIENRLIHELEELKLGRLKKIQRVVEQRGLHVFNIEEYSLLLVNKELRTLKGHIKSFTQVDYLGLYKSLFLDKNLLSNLAKDLQLPSHIEDVKKQTLNNLRSNRIPYEDCGPLLYLKLQLEGSQHFSSIRHLVIDEAQDYYPLQYEIFRLLFNHSSFTILGDFNQTLEKTGNPSIYDEVSRILAKDKAIKLSLNRGYRSSYEISLFSQKIIGSAGKDFAPFMRHGSKPEFIQGLSLDDLQQSMAKNIDIYYEQGYESIAVICKTYSEAISLQKSLQKYTNHHIQTVDKHEVKKGVLVIPAYMAKGLEFDAVLIYNVGQNNYSSSLDKKLIYIACTRALHELSLYYMEPLSKHLNFNM